ncbi:MAG TPA: DUF3800 domain-containing protein [Candidatus Binataceae bacterium]|nr:DUF3800 domain-containing protein [Candidatus Binataceae bacterium]
MSAEDFELYFDDSGTHAESEIAVAGCYIAPKDQWERFGNELDHARKQLGFDCFHMADVMARRSEFANWDAAKRTDLLWRLSCLIKTRVTIGIACAVPRKAWDTHVPDKYKEIIGARHYTFAVRSVIGVVEQWRKKYRHRGAMRYVFDRMSQGKGEIMSVMDVAKEFPDEALQKYGLLKGNYSFEDKRGIKPLQAADMLAWETYNHMRSVVLKNSSSSGTPNFQYLRQHPSRLIVAWLTEAQVKKMVDQMLAHEEHTGTLPFWTHGSSPVSEEGFGMV